MESLTPFTIAAAGTVLAILSYLIGKHGLPRIVVQRVTNPSLEELEEMPPDVVQQLAHRINLEKIKKSINTDPDCVKCSRSTECMEALEKGIEMMKQGEIHQGLKLIKDTQERIHQEEAKF